MAISKSEKQLLAEKIYDPYYAIIWSHNIYSIIEKENEYEDINDKPNDMTYNEFLASDLHKENCKLYSEYLNTNLSKYKSIINSIFIMTDIFNNQEINDIVNKLEIEFDNGYSVGKTEIEPELVKIQNITWDEIETKYNNNEITGNWNDIAYLLTIDRQAEYLKSKYIIEFKDTTLLELYLSKNKDYVLPD